MYLFPDGIDGKQARRTQTCGPLGELFDHGLDSWSTMFITTALYSVFGIYTSFTFHLINNFDIIGDINEYQITYYSRINAY